MRIKDRYEYDPAKDLVGKGGFARVFRAQDTLLNREVALKVFSQSDREQYSVLQEIRKAIQLEHPNLLRYYDVVLLEQSNALGEKEELQIGVMEYANAGDLKHYAKANPGSPLIKRFLREVLLGLDYLHNHGIIHRDLKAQNILLLERGGQLTAKISDFGISKNMSAGDTRSSSMLVGTIEYMAPEQFNPRKFGIGGKIHSNVDLWGFGVMVHELLTDQTPFGKRGGETTAEQIMASILSPELPEDIEKLEEPYRTIVKKCLVANAKDRVQKASDLLGDLQDGQPAAIASTAAEPEDAAATRMFTKDDVPAAQTAPFVAPPAAPDEDGGSGTVFYDAKKVSGGAASGGAASAQGAEPVSAWDADFVAVTPPDDDPVVEDVGVAVFDDGAQKRRRMFVNMAIAVAAVLFLAFVAFKTMNGDDKAPTAPVQASSGEVDKAADAKTVAEPEPETDAAKTDAAKTDMAGAAAKAAGEAAEKAADAARSKQAADAAAKAKQAAIQPKKCEDVCTMIPGQPTTTQSTTTVSAGEFSYPAGSGIPQDRARSMAANACGGSGSLVTFSASPDGQCGGNLCFARVRATCRRGQTTSGPPTRKCERVCR